MEDIPMPFRLGDQSTFEDIGVKVTGHIASPRGLKLVAVRCSHTESDLHAMTSTGWVLQSFISSPKGSLRIDSGKEMLLPRFLFLPPNVPIQWRSSPSVSAVCHFGPDFMTGLLELEPRLGLNAVDCLLTKGTERLAYLSQQAFTESLSPGFGAPLLAEAIGMEIALEVVRCHRGRSLEQMPLRGGLAPWQMRRLDSYVRAHLSGDLSLHRLATVLGMSERHLSRVIKREKGISVHRWVADLRLDETRRLLTGTKLPLHEIARRVAFKSLSSFSTAFRAACGLSPSEYRRLTLKRGHISSP